MIAKQRAGSAATPHIEGLYETHLTVASLAVSIPFYRDPVGLELAETFGDRVAFLRVDDKR